MVQINNPKVSWKHIAMGWRYEDASGWYFKSRRQKMDSKWYYFDATGHMVINTKLDDCWIGAGACK